MALQKKIYVKKHKTNSLCSWKGTVAVCELHGRFATIRVVDKGQSLFLGEAAGHPEMGRREETVP